MPDDAPPLAADLPDILAEIIAGATDTPPSRWRRLIMIEKSNLTLSPHTNWVVVAKGRPTERDTIEKAAAVVRQAHPYVDW